MAGPSRTDNPFATCWTDPERAPLCVRGEGELGQLASRLESAGWRGAIIGPHGVGKSTLARAIARFLEQRGQGVVWRELHGGDKRSAEELLPEGATRGTLVVVDGYEQLSCRQRWQLRRGCRQRGLGLLVTAHRATWLPTLVRLEPREEVALAVYRELTRNATTAVTLDDVRAAFATERGNLREVLFRLYDLHELRRHPS